MTLSGHKSTIVCYLFSPDYHGQNEGIIVTAGAKRRDGFHDIDDCWTGVATIWDAEAGGASLRRGSQLAASLAAISRRWVCAW
ncbi:hypothetical protein JL720_5074 [Aureococcus anophagefferens]|nr:hypothetical protein JL720_5074 [Aureococcus anophagefferens]